MRNRKLAARYARALLDALPDDAHKQNADAFLAALADAMQASRELRDLLLDPAVPRSAKRSALEQIARQQQMPRMIENFLHAVVDHGRTAMLPEIAVVFHEERERTMGIVPATLTTAVPLADDLRQRARQALERLSGRKVNLSFDVEPDLIGGAVARVGSTVYDGSLRTQLVRLRKQMAEG